MDEVTRRAVLRQAAAPSVLAAFPREDDPVPDTDRGRVIAVGMTEAEADCWEKIASATGAFFALPELHPLDASEVATAVHVV